MTMSLTSRAIKLRYRTSNKLGVIASVTRLLKVRMTKETVAGAHSFVDEVRALRCADYDPTSLMED